MRANIIRLLPILACLSMTFAVTRAHAQGCRLDYTFNYDSYTTESTDGSNIYTTVLTDGSGSGSPSPSCIYPNARHTPGSYNTITPTGGNPIGGWQYGSPGYMTSYLSIQNDQQVVGSPGVIYLFDSDGEVICTVFGTLYYFSDEVGIGLHRATYAATPGTGNSCNFNLSCPAGETAVCGTSAYNSGAGNPCQAPWLNLIFFSVTRGTTKSCFGVSPNIWSETQGHCD